MKHEWKPGDVATYSDERVAFTDRGWTWLQTGLRCMSQEHVGGHARPLVVIDPEDRNAAHRLALLVASAYDATENDDDAMQVALREFADPKPPRPEEPTGLGAVVEDTDGIRWTRVETAQTVSRNPWFPATDIDAQPEEYRDIAVVRVLSEGIQ